MQPQWKPLPHCLSRSVTSAATALLEPQPPKLFLKFVISSWSFQILQRAQYAPVTVVAAELQF